MREPTKVNEVLLASDLTIHAAHFKTCAASLNLTETMHNPYEPSSTHDPAARPLSSLIRRRIAGAWLAGVGVTLLFANYFYNRTQGIGALDWTPAWLIGLGVCVAIGFRLADTLARLIGSFSIMAMVIVLVALLAGVGGETEINYGTGKVAEPSAGHLCLFMACVSAALLPPWWLLQTAFRD
ncbi:hypothetical protein [Neorhodopirellula lusitana]|uniref:hypothetical protein n=1 Tax=Neorhodopirellula lusitana TaxID=445327 RepID=UPI00384F5BD5